MHPEVPYKKVIANHIRKRIKEGVTIKVILDEVNSKFEDAPKHVSILYRKYGNDIAEARAELQGDLGALAYERAKESDKILELFLRSKAGWNPQSSVTVTEGDPEDLDEDTSAIDELKSLLGRNKTDSGE